MNRPDPSSVPEQVREAKTTVVSVRLTYSLLGRLDELCWKRRERRSSVLTRLVEDWVVEQEALASPPLDEKGEEIDHAKMEAEYELARKEGRVW